ncbi:MAG: SpoIID/LytB domain-containing protein, partial [Clostridia bacterium]|nr:SpoIID/LytB domain-containing protein [Clostridia bacterium]
MFKRFACLFALLCVLLSVNVSFSAQAELRTDIRVYLRRLQLEDTLHIRVNGTYVINDHILVKDGSQLSVTLRDNQLILHSDHLSEAMGERIHFERMHDEKGSSLCLQGGSSLYEGSLTLTIADNKIYPILTINIEDYLLGVVPYEMGDSFPIEALKAQAIAARTYALGKSGASGSYDVDDTTNDQAYKGRSSSSPLSEQAVMETSGLCGVYDGSLAQCYYSASNGGQTELGQHAWPTSEPDAYGYMDMRDDPYDLENDASSVKRYTLGKHPGKEGVGAALHSVLVASMKDQLAAIGAAAEDDLIRFDEIVSLQAHTPMYDGESRLMSQMTFTVRISVRDALFRDTTTPAPSAEVMPDATPTPTPKPTATPAYSAYRTVEQPLTVTIPYFPDIEKAMGLSINVYQNELITVLDVGSAYVIESRRFGHGVGMSQRGAEQMARKYGMTYDQILAFYYPGMSVRAYDTIAQELPQANALLVSTPAPLPSATPRPTH